MNSINNAPSSGPSTPPTAMFQNSQQDSSSGIRSFSSVLTSPSSVSGLINRTQLQNSSSGRTTPSPLNLNLPHGTTNNKTSSTTSDQNYTPSRKNAIIIENTNETPQDSCLRKVADIIGGKNIHYCTRLSGGRICLYLTNEECVTKAVEEGGIIVNLVYLPIRRYVTEATKLVVSNCPPELDDEKLKEILKPYGRIVSSPTRLKVSTNHDDLKHIKTWRRVVYIMKGPDSQELPKRLNIRNSEEINYTLYLDTDEVMCDYCKRPGHHINKCKKKISDDQNFPDMLRPSFVHSTPTEKEVITNSRPTISLQSTKEVSSEVISDAIISSEPKQQKTSEDDINSRNSTQNLVLQSVQKIQSNNKNPSSVTSESRNNFVSSDFNKFEEIINRNSSQSPQLPGQVDKSLTTNAEELEMLLDPASFSLPGSSKNDQEDLELESIQKVSTSHNPKKRPFSNSPTQEDSEDSSTSTASNISNKSQNMTKKQKKKREKEDTQINILLNMMKPKSSYIEEKTFREFIVKARGAQNSKVVAASLGVTNISALIVQLNDAANTCQDANLQRRLRRASDALLTHNES